MPAAVRAALVAGLTALALPGAALAQAPGPSTGGAPAGAEDSTSSKKRTLSGRLPDGAVRGAATPRRNLPRITKLSTSEAAPGKTIRLRGRNLGKRVDAVVFVGGRGEEDDATAAPRRKVRIRRGRGLVRVRVPLTARSGRLALINSDGSRGRKSRRKLTVAAPATSRTVSSGLSIDASVQDVKVGAGGVRPPQLAYVVRAPAPVAVAVVLVRVSDGVPVAGWPVQSVQPGVVQRVTWNGQVAGIPGLAPEGEYRWQVAAHDASGGKAVASARRTAKASQAAGGELAFTFLHQLFPVQGPHAYGTFVNRFGGGRGHQGQDVLAACGSPLVAVRAGTVRAAGREGAAGNFIAIDTPDGGSYGYMHLRSRPRLKAGDSVRTGQSVGRVGSTGRSSGCHLHFEQWPDGWREGRPTDPLSDLLTWDETS